MDEFETPKIKKLNTRVFHLALLYIEKITKKCLVSFYILYTKNTMIYILLIIY